jgi:hypothetical protein
VAACVGCYFEEVVQLDFQEVHRGRLLLKLESRRLGALLGCDDEVEGDGLGEFDAGGGGGGDLVLIGAGWGEAEVGVGAASAAAGDPKRG